MPKPAERIIKLQVECTELPPEHWDGHAEIWLGIQQGKEVVQAVKIPAQTARFEAELRVLGEPGVGNPNFLGPYAQGSAQDRFFYLCWGSQHGIHWHGFRRAKIPLTHLTWEELAAGELWCKVRCTDAKGGPVCATLRNEFVSWTSAPDT